MVQVEFDPARVSYEALLDVFFKIHDPTQKDRQGMNVGTQYRSVIFYHSAEQKVAAEAAVARLQQGGKTRRPVSTQLVPAPTFWRAEEYHQQYYARRGLSGCKI